MPRTRNRIARAVSLAMALLATLDAPVVAGAGGAEAAKPAPAAAPAPATLDPSDPGFAAHVMKKIDDQYRGEKSHGTMEMTVVTKHFTRSMKLEAWSLGEDYSLVRILEPKKEKGTATLKAKDDLFTYLSNTGKTMKIASGMMGGSWMGSHFTNDDLVQHSRLSEDYDISLLFSGEASGVLVHRFSLVPRKDAAVVWGKIVISVRQSDLQPLRELFYDEDGRKVRVLKFSKHQEVQGRVIPTRMVMAPLDVEGESTTMTWKEIDFGVDLDKGFFTLQKLKSL